MAVPVAATAAVILAGQPVVECREAGRAASPVAVCREAGRAASPVAAEAWADLTAAARAVSLGGGGGMGGFGGEGGQRGQRGGQQRQMSKDEQDRTIFDGQAITLFSFLLEKIGIDKVKELIKQAQEGKETREYLSRPDVLGSDFEKIEEAWTAWVKAQK